MRGRLIRGSEGLARSSVSGHILSPKPAARTIAFMMPLHHSSAVRHRVKAAQDGAVEISGMENCCDQGRGFHVIKTNHHLRECRPAPNKFPVGMSRAPRTSCPSEADHEAAGAADRAPDSSWRCSPMLYTHAVSRPRRSGV